MWKKAASWKLVASGNGAKTCVWSGENRYQNLPKIKPKRADVIIGYIKYIFYINMYIYVLSILKKTSISYVNQHDQIHK